MKLTEKEKEKIEEDFRRFVSIESIKMTTKNGEEKIDDNGKIGVRGESTVQNFRQKISSGDENQVLMSKANSERV